jgi:TonB family protein
MANVFGRSIAGTYRFEDSYQHGGTVMVDVTVDANGRVTSASARPGCPFPELNSIAERRAKQIKFTPGAQEQTGTIRIKFEAPRG